MDERQFLTGALAVAEGAALARVQVVAAYPITPQTAIVESLARRVFGGSLKAEMIPVESEHSALSAVVGASLTGARAFTATSSQGLALMHEVLPYASGLRLPIVMAVANRSLASPVTIFVDHMDTLPERDSGWVQIYAETAQEAMDHILLGYRLAEDERVLLPVMICLDGFFVSHTSEPVSVPEAGRADAFLPPPAPKYPHLDVDAPKIFNVMAFPDHFEEFLRDKHESCRRVLEILPGLYEEFDTTFGRRYRTVDAYRTDDAEYVLFGLGSMMGTVKEVVDGLREQGKKVGAARIACYRPFDDAAVAAAVRGARAVGVLDRDVSFGSGGVVYQDVLKSLHGAGMALPTANFIVGLGGRDVSPATVEKCFAALEAGPSGGQAVWADERADLLKTWGVL
jgi:pyruvate ferredoxin oxidoreductase alpha subunit